jgi:short-subunit dehydrogenase
VTARYGPWAVIAGASEGIGAAFATRLAASGLNLVLSARGEHRLRELAAVLQTETVVVPADLATDAGRSALTAATAGLEVGLVVANAAYAPIGPFLDIEPAELHRIVALNCDMPLALARHYLPAMVERRRGGLIIMSSMAGQQGSPRIATYAATKAFGAILAEGLWREMQPHAVDVVACVAGAVTTPALGRAKPKRAPGTVSPDTVARTALDALGRGPRVVPGGLMKVSAALTARVLPKRLAIALIDKASSDLRPLP